jgi:hypothetical protein
MKFFLEQKEVKDEILKSLKRSKSFRVNEMYSEGTHFMASIMGTHYRYECVSKGVRVGAGQYYKWIEGLTTWEKRIEINLIPVTVSQ